MNELIEVSEDRFYAVIGKLNVHPCPDRDMCEWRSREGKEIARSSQGYIPRHGEPEKFYILREYLDGDNDDPQD